MPDLNEYGKNIARKIRLYTTKELHIQPSKIDDQPNIWRKQDFIAELLLNVEEQKYYAPGEKIIREIKDDFVNETGLQINLDTLFKKQWLRIVTDIVFMPAAIRRSIFTAKKIKDCKHEILFLRTIEKDKNNSMLVTEFEELVKQYEQENKIGLDIKKAIDAHLLSTDNDKVKINNIEYYKPVIENWNEFLFLTFYYDKIHGKHNNLIISKDKLTALYFKHVQNYSLTPALSELLSSGLGSEISEGYIISLFQMSYCSNDTLDQVGAILWRKLNTIHSSMPQDQLLKIWCRIMIINGHYKIDIHKYLSHNENSQFNNAAVSVIMQEADLEISSIEYKKAILDYYMTHDLLTIQQAEYLTNFEFPKDSKDAFDTMKAISIMQRGTTDDYLYFSQSSREIVSYLIGQVVKSHSCEDIQMNKINELTDDIYKKPYLLWTLCFWLWEWRPELIPSLMQNVKMTSILFSIVKKFTIIPHTFESSSEIKFGITSKLFIHLLNIIQSNSEIPQNQKAKIVFDSLLTITTLQFHIKGQSSKQQRKIQDEAISLVENIKYTFANQSNQYSIYGESINTKEKYYPTLLKDLFVHVSNLIQENKYNNGMLDFHYEKISLLLFLSKLSQDIPVKNKSLKLNSYILSRAILECYTNTISATSIISLDYENWNSKQVTPTFLPISQNIEAIDWATIYLLLEEENISSEYLKPMNLTFNEEGDEYDKFNRFIMSKLRCHLKILILTYRQLKNRETELKNRGVEIKNNLIRIQTAILDIAIQFSFNESLKRRFDIFNNIQERSTFSSQNDELIPQLGEISNYFDMSAREKLINALLRTDIFVRALKLLAVMSSEQDQNLLLRYINAQQLQVELKHISFNDFQFLLSTLSQHLEFQDKAREALAYWENRVASRGRDLFSNEIAVTIYRTKLLLAFQADDLKAIEEVQEPEGEIYINTSKFSPQNEKNFYKALHYFKNDNPEKAYFIYDELMYHKDDDTTTIALNRFASKLKWAEKENDLISKKILFGEALAEWDLYRKNLAQDISLEHLTENVFYNRLLALDALERYDDFDNAYSTLSFIDRVKQGFFEIVVRNKLKRNMNAEAAGLIKEATEFHKLKDGSIPDFITEMNNLAVKSNDPETLKNIFNTVINTSPEVLVTLIPDHINDGKNPNSYILNYIVNAASNMLSTINAVSNISSEDKYSDLMQMGLNNLMKFHNWHVSPARGGFSDSILNNPGEIDFAIYANNEELAICEALNLKGENNYEVAKHSIKIFNYTPAKKGLFLIVYYKGPEANFITSWEKYQNSIQNNVDFPESYLFVKDSFQDFSSKYNIAAIKVGTSNHGQDIILHHVFININYKANI